MLRKLIVATGLIGMAALAPAASAGIQSAPGGRMGAENQSLVQEVQYWDFGRCRAWRRECADRWGWRTPRFHRCLARHGCERHRYDD